MRRAALLGLAALLVGSALAQSPDDLMAQGIKLTAAQAQAVEESLRANPEDLAARGKLIAYYFVSQARESWSTHVFWLIEHHPESPLAGSKFAGGAFPADPLNSEADYVRARDLWLEQTRRHPDDVRVWTNARRFCSQAGCDPDGVLGGSTAPERPIPRLRIGDGDFNFRKLLKKVDPIYPPMALKARIQGTVHFTAIIGRDGHVRDLKILSGHPLLIVAAQEAVKQWVYQPTLLNGRPVEVETPVDVSFMLPATK